MIWRRSDICAPSRWIPSPDPRLPGRKLLRRQRAVSLISTPVPTSSGPTACRITSGDGGMRKLYALYAALWCGLWMVAGCAGPSIRDFQMTQAALKAESAQAQRTITDLRAEMQGVQRDLGAARAAQARLEGELREAQPRVQVARRALEAEGRERGGTAGGR